MRLMNRGSADHLPIEVVSTGKLAPDARSTARSAPGFRASNGT